METFQQQLRKTVIERIDPKLTPKEVLTDIFKTYVAKMLERNVLTNKNRLSADFLAMTKGYLITEFRAAELGEHQMSEKQYSDMFDATMKEIFNTAAHAHEGEDKSEFANQTLSVDKRGYQDMKKSAGGIYLP